MDRMETMQQCEYLLQIQIKDERIKVLEDEIKSLKFTLGSKENEYCSRENELLQELDRHAELVEKLQSRIRTYEANKRKNKALSYQNVPTNSFVPQQRSSFNMGVGHSSRKGAAGSTYSDTNIDADAICTLLQSFIDKNKPCNSSSKVQSDSMLLRAHDASSSLFERTEDEQFAAQMGKLIAENSSLFLQLQQDLSNVLGGGLDADQQFDSVDDLSATAMPLMSENSLLESFQNSFQKSDYNLPDEGQRHLDFDEIMQSVINKANSDSDTQSINEHSTTRTFPAPKTTNNDGKVTAKRCSVTLMPKPISEEEQIILREMQKRITANIELLGIRPLHTMEVAKQCKRLMTSYNIGQRLFAKTVMCQVSQGSLSELLSKPRPWKKLTDKGREAFRRIYGWISDDKAIELLCQLSPRRTAIPIEKIEHPSPDDLFEDSSVEDFETTLANSSDKSCENNLAWLNLDYAPKESNANREERLRSIEPSSHPIEFSVTTSKELSSSEPPSNKTQATTFTNSGGRGSANRWKHDDIPKEKILDIFETEKAKILELESNIERTLTRQSSSSADRTPLNSPSKKTRSLDANSTQKLYEEQLSPSSISVQNQLLAMFPNGKRVYLTPVCQDQFDKYAYLDTDELVKQIKEYLCRNSVSQRQFGESVLGLSQGSVSDLLARPKCWNTLTHKGREPFIRMQMFLDDYIEQQQLLSANAEAAKKDGEDNAEMDTTPLLNESSSDEQSDTIGDEAKTFIVKVEKMIEDVCTGSDINGESAKDVDQIADAELQQDEDQLEELIGEHPEKTEMPAEVDTVEVAKKVKQCLAKNGISQRAFGQWVLNGSTGGYVSDLLSHPRKWILTSPKAQDAYRRMHEFLHQGQNAIEKLKLQEQRRCELNLNLKSAINSLQTSESLDESEATSEQSIEDTKISASNVLGKRKANSGSEMSLLETLFSNSSADLNSKMLDSGASAKKIPRFQRTLITDKQKDALWFIFLRDQRPSAKCMDEIASRLDLYPRTVTNWFHNHRTRSKSRDVAYAEPSIAKETKTINDPEREELFNDMSELLLKHSETVNKAVGTPQLNANVQQQAPVSDKIEEFVDKSSRKGGKRVHNENTIKTSKIKLDKVIARLSKKF